MAARRVAEPKRRARLAQKLIKRLSGTSLVTLANLVTRIAGYNLSFSYDVNSKSYVCREAELSHRFAHPKRLFTVFNGLLARGEYLRDVYLLDLVDLKDNDWVVEVGANSGDVSLAFGTLGTKVNLIAFEPAPIEFAVMSANVTNSPFLLETRVHQLALWNSSDNDLTFYVKTAKADNSLIEIPNPDQIIKVKAARLDEVLEPRNYKLLKLEAEGAEPEILEGASGIIRNFEYITVDVGFERGMRAESTILSVVTTLTSNGFELIGFNGTRFVVLFKRRD
ncbi:FkbM family methyltransferase [Shimia marina]|nr:FkbM family methyltransferase [Shimia marina]SFE49335.1 methyltransferase, FkbM family [Shimia marina]